MSARVEGGGLKRRVDTIGEISPEREAKRPRMQRADAKLGLIAKEKFEEKEEKGAGDQLTPPLGLSQEVVAEPGVARLSPSEQRMFDNFKEAMRDHNIDPDTLGDFTPKTHQKPISLQVDSSSEKGVRPEMEDAHLERHRIKCGKEKVGYGMAIFDGHADKGQLSKFALERTVSAFDKITEEQLKRAGSGFFQPLNHQIHDKIEPPSGGTTALQCLLKTGSNYLITSTLGDSEAAVVRKINGEWRMLFLSRKTANWGHPEAEKRFKEFYKDKPDVIAAWSAQKPKERRFPHLKGLNLSEALGDKNCFREGKTAISQTSHETLFQVMEDDIILLGCDGLWDMLLSPHDGKLERGRVTLLLQFIVYHLDQPNLAELIVKEFALKHGSTDNVTVICARVKARGEEASEATPPIM